MTDAKLAKYFGWLTLEIWLLIAFGGSVRAMNAGLACPDWPLCFGDVIPDYHPQVYFEFIHRVLAGIVGIASIALAFMVFRRPGITRAVKVMAALSVVIYFSQAILGGLTVLLQLKESVVVAHLLMGTVYFAMNLWTYLTLKKGESSTAVSPLMAKAVWGVVAVIGGQIFLGGLVASHYAALVCTDFPKCHGEWVPTLSGIIGLHVMHRFGGYLTAFVVMGLFYAARLSSPPFRKWTRWMATIVVLQVWIGIANVIFLTPPLITVLHLAAGVALFGLALRAGFEVRHSPKGSHV